MVEKMVHDGVPDDMSAQSLFDKATPAKNMMSRIRGYSPSVWVLATQLKIHESVMIDDELHQLFIVARRTQNDCAGFSTFFLQRPWRLSASI